MTNNSALAERIRMLSAHGQTQRYHHQVIGVNSRLDAIQAAILAVKLRYLDHEIQQRQCVAKCYDEALGYLAIEMPIVKADRRSAYGQYTIKINERDRVQASLKAQGIPTVVHYPMPLPYQPCFAELGYQQGDFPVAEQVCSQVLSLPMHAFLTEQQQDLICAALQD